MATLIGESAAQRELETGQLPQSLGHVVHVSPPLHAPSPQAVGHGPQSAAQVEHVSPPLQLPSPQLGAFQTPQSAGQFEHVSLPLQIPLPQLFPSGSSSDVAASDTDSPVSSATQLVEPTATK